MVKSIHKFKIFKADAAPFFFYIDIFPSDITAFKAERAVVLIKNINENPIMPLPMRVDRVFNGESSILIRPREPISVPLMDNNHAIINPDNFIQFGIEKLLYFTEIRGYERFTNSLVLEKAKKWWDSTKFLTTKLSQLEEDFSVFLQSYIGTVLKAKLTGEDLISAANKYCKSVQNTCEKRLKENSILVETTRKENRVEMYTQKIARSRKKMKKVDQLEYHPELVDIDIYNLSERGFSNNIENLSSNLEVPLLIYDDLLECMLQNLKKLDDGDENILDPSFLINKQIIIVQKSEDLENFKAQEYSWFNAFEELNLESIFQSLRTTLLEFLKTQRIPSKKNLFSPNSPSSSI